MMNPFASFLFIVWGLAWIAAGVLVAQKNHPSQRGDSFKVWLIKSLKTVATIVAFQLFGLWSGIAFTLLVFWFIRS